MTELILHVGERLAALDQERGVGVPEVVEADPTEARLLEQGQRDAMHEVQGVDRPVDPIREYPRREITALNGRSEEHTSELQSHSDLVCRLLLEKKKKYRARSSGARYGRTGSFHRRPSCNRCYT